MCSSDLSTFPTTPTSIWYYFVFFIKTWLDCIIHVSSTLQHKPPESPPWSDMQQLAYVGLRDVDREERRVLKELNIPVRPLVR